MALGMGVVKLTEDSESDPKSEKYRLGKTGWMLLEDDLTRVNFWFTNDICYEGAWDLEASIKNGKPEGLKVLVINGLLFTKLFLLCPTSLKNPGLNLTISILILLFLRHFQLYLRKSQSIFWTLAEIPVSGH